MSDIAMIGRLKAALWALCIVGTAVPCAAIDTDSILGVLDREVKHAPARYVEKEDRIADLRNSLALATNDNTRFYLCDELYNQYKFFQYDSAYTYANRMYLIALADNGNQQNQRLNRARMALMECYNSVGLFKEADDMRRNIVEADIEPDCLTAYYNILATFYRNMSSFAGADSDLGHKYLDSIRFYNNKLLAVAPAGTYHHAAARITARELDGNASHTLLAAEYAALPDAYAMTDHDLAVVHSQAGRAYRDAGNLEKTIEHLALSAIYDLRSCTRETTAAKDLAQVMHDIGELDRANTYIHHALADAVAFNSRTRQIEINNVLPHIETSIHNRSRTRTIMMAIIIIAVAGCLILSLFLFVQLRRRNSMLKETAEIKDQYIIQSLIGNTDFIDTVEDSIKRALNKLRSHQPDQAVAILRGIDTKTERQRMYNSFDSAFLRLFPNFPEAFNALFPPEERMQIDTEHGLPTDVRIYALMRLGIDSTAEISKYLSLSANTIYVYKTRLKSKAIVPKDEFENRIMNIPKP